MSVFVFLGPTLPRREAESILDAHYLPPAAQGDVLRLMRRRPQIIGLIDGYFERVAAVWHKELLWAMSRGVRVFGAASMGALRAVELAAFGMRGVGRVFTQFQSGALEADDEVAVIHADAASGYRPLSQALVNMRETLAAAAAAGVLDAETTRALVEIARCTFYPERSYEALVREGYERGLPGAALAGLERWLTVHQVDQKRLDAIALLERLREARNEAEPPPASFLFEHTDAWDAAVSRERKTRRSR